MVYLKSLYSSTAASLYDIDFNEENDSVSFTTISHNARNEAICYVFTSRPPFIVVLRDPFVSFARFVTEDLTDPSI